LAQAWIETVSHTANEPLLTNKYSPTALELARTKCPTGSVGHIDWNNFNKS
jgi:hypothetical protein